MGIGSFMKRTQLSVEKPDCFISRMWWNTGVTTHVCVQRLLLRSEGIEQFQRHFPVVVLIVPLQQNMQRDSHTTSLFNDRIRHKTASEQHCGGNARLDRGQTNRDGDQTSRTADSIANLRQLGEGVHSRLPFRYSLVDEGENESVDGVTSYSPTGPHRLKHLGARFVHTVRPRSMSGSGKFDGDRCETATCGVLSTRKHPRIGLIQAKTTRLPGQNQWNRLRF